MFDVNISVKMLIKEVLFHSPFRGKFFPLYEYNFTPAQLCFLCQCIDDTRHIKGAIAEIGCSSGATTIFLKKYMESVNIDKPYYAIDTFSGFVAEDMDFEVTARGKSKNFFVGFEVNKRKWFDGTMRQNSVSDVTSIEADVNKYDLTGLGPLSFVLLDVDLYQPMKKCLYDLYQVLAPGGMIVVDDCDSSNIKWDGSEQAYKEFMKEREQACQIVLRKLGIVKKEAS